MSSCHETPIDLSEDTRNLLVVASESTPPNAFGRMMGATASTASSPAPQQRDRCKRPVPSYNSNYDPYKLPADTLPGGYSPYVNREPLFDNRAIIVNRLPTKYIVASASKKPRTAWVWKLGYALINTTKQSNNQIWCCKYCTYNS